MMTLLFPEGNKSGDTPLRTGECMCVVVGGTQKDKKACVQHFH